MTQESVATTKTGYLSGIAGVVQASLRQVGGIVRDSIPSSDELLALSVPNIRNAATQVLGVTSNSSNARMPTNTMISLWSDLSSDSRLVKEQAMKQAIQNLSTDTSELLNEQLLIIRLLHTNGIDCSSFITKILTSVEERDSRHIGYLLCSQLVKETDPSRLLVVNSLLKSVKPDSEDTFTQIACLGHLLRLLTIGTIAMFQQPLLDLISSDVSDDNVIIAAFNCLRRIAQITNTSHKNEEAAHQLHEIVIQLLWNSTSDLLDRTSVSIRAGVLPVVRDFVTNNPVKGSHLFLQRIVTFHAEISYGKDNNSTIPTQGIIASIYKKIPAEVWKTEDGITSAAINVVGSLTHKYDNKRETIKIGEVGVLSEMISVILYIEKCGRKTDLLKRSRQALNGLLQHNSSTIRNSGLSLLRCVADCKKKFNNFEMKFIIKSLKSSCQSTQLLSRKCLYASYESGLVVPDTTVQLFKNDIQNKIHNKLEVKSYLRQLCSLKPKSRKHLYHLVLMLVALPDCLFEYFYPSNTIHYKDLIEYLTTFLEDKGIRGRFLKKLMPHASYVIAFELTIHVVSKFIQQYYSRELASISQWCQSVYHKYCLIGKSNKAMNAIICFSKTILLTAECSDDNDLYQTVNQLLHTIPSYLVYKNHHVAELVVFSDILCQTDDMKCVFLSKDGIPITDDKMSFLDTYSDAAWLCNPVQLRARGNRLTLKNSVEKPEETLRINSYSENTAKKVSFCNKNATTTLSNFLGEETHSESISEQLVKTEPVWSRKALLKQKEVSLRISNNQTWPLTEENNKPIMPIIKDVKLNFDDIEKKQNDEEQQLKPLLSNEEKQLHLNESSNGGGIAVKLIDKVTVSVWISSLSSETIVGIKTSVFRELGISNITTTVDTTDSYLFPKVITPHHTMTETGRATRVIATKKETISDIVLISLHCTDKEASQFDKLTVIGGSVTCSPTEELDGDIINNKTEILKPEIGEVIINGRTTVCPFRLEIDPIWFGSPAMLTATQFSYYWSSLSQEHQTTILFDHTDSHPSIVCSVRCYNFSHISFVNNIAIAATILPKKKLVLFLFEDVSGGSYNISLRSESENSNSVALNSIKSLLLNPSILR